MVSALHVAVRLIFQHVVEISLDCRQRNPRMHLNQPPHPGNFRENIKKSGLGNSSWVEDVHFFGIIQDELLIIVPVKVKLCRKFVYSIFYYFFLLQLLFVNSQLIPFFLKSRKVDNFFSFFLKTVEHDSLNGSQKIGDSE